MITAKLYGKEIQANTIKGIKCKATKIANDYWKPYDEMEATFESGHSAQSFLQIITQSNFKMN